MNRSFSLLSVFLAGALLLAPAMSVPASDINIRLGDIFAFTPDRLEGDDAARFGALIDDGQGEEALALAEELAANGSAVGHFLRGFAYEAGLGMDMGVAGEAEASYRAGAEAGHIPSMANLAVLLMRSDPASGEAGRLLRQAADEDPARAGLFLGIAKLSRTMGTPDFAEVEATWMKAAEAGESEAFRYLGYLHQGAFGFPERADLRRSADFLEKAAEAGDAEAAILLGRLILMQGAEIERLPEEAGRWFERAAESDSPAAIFLLAQVREEGLGGAEPDLERARELYAKAAAMEHGPSLLKLGYFYERGLGGEADVDEAIRLYRRAAENGEGGGFYNLGIAYRTGMGVATDTASAFRNFIRAGLLGNPMGATQVGAFYLSGEGVEADPVAAAAWFLRAAEAGESNAMVNLAEMMLDGRGIPFNAELLGNLCSQALQRGNPRAGFLLARMAERGVAIERNPSQALAFFRWAAERGHEGAQAEAERLEGELDEAAVNAADDFLRDLEGGLEGIPEEIPEGIDGGIDGGQPGL